MNSIVVRILQAGLANADQVARLKHMLGDGLTVDERAAAAFEIGEDVLAVFNVNLAVDAGHVRIDKARSRGPAAADQEGLRFQRERSPLVRPRQHDQLLSHDVRSAPIDPLSSFSERRGGLSRGCNLSSTINVRVR
jgi:hypothetical protein